MSIFSFGFDTGLSAFTTDDYSLVHSEAMGCACPGCCSLEDDTSTTANAMGASMANQSPVARLPPRQRCKKWRHT